MGRTLLRLALDLGGRFLRYHPGQDAVLDLPGDLAFVVLSRRPGLQPGVNAVLHLVELQKEAIDLGGDDEAGGHRQLQVLDDYRQVVGLAAGEFRAVQGSLSQGNNERHLTGQAEPPPELRLQGNKNPVQSGVELEMAVSGNEIQPLHHMKQQGVHLVDSIRQVLAVEDIFAAGFLSQIGNKFHNLLMVLQQLLETLKDPRKGHQALLGPLDPFPEVMEILPHIILLSFWLSVLG